jgi:hypothetical protein
VRAFVLFHGKRHPRELGLSAVHRFLEHVVKTEKQPLPALENARSALALLFGPVLGMDLGELPRPQPTRLLDQMRQVMRVRHYDLPVDPELRLVAKRFRNSQETDGEWQYESGRPKVNPPHPTMTAAGLLGLALGYGLDNEAKTEVNMAEDAVLQQGLKRLTKNIGQPGDRINFISFGLLNASRFFSSRRKSTPKIGIIRGVEILLANQKKDGAWQLGQVGCFDLPDTCQFSECSCGCGASRIKIYYRR